MQQISREAVSALHDEHAAELRAFLAGVLRDVDLAREALQSTFSRLLEQGHTAREESIKGWLFRVAYHEAMLIKRKQGTRERSLARLARDWSRQSESPEQAAELKDAVTQARAALSRLPRDQRIVVEMRIYEDKKFAQIAEELNVPLGTVLTRMRTALATLRREVGRMKDEGRTRSRASDASLPALGRGGWGERHFGVACGATNAH